jgi:hypothetical protein
VEEQLKLIMEACDSLHSNVHLANVVHGLLASGNHLNYGAASTGAAGMLFLLLSISSPCLSPEGVQAC